MIGKVVSRRKFQKKWSAGSFCEGSATWAKFKDYRISKSSTSNKIPE